MNHPVDSSARQRLIEAQRAETAAVRDAEAAERARDRVAGRLAKADEKVMDAQRALVATSGIPRAALLLGVDEAALRRNTRRGAPEPTID